LSLVRIRSLLALYLNFDCTLLGISTLLVLG